MSTNWLAAAPPRLRVQPQADRNDAAEVVDLAAAYGTVLDGWQVDALTAGLGVLPDGRWAAPTVGINVSRQNGKSVCLVVRALAGALLFGEQTVILSAHEQKTSRVLFQNLLGYFDGYPDLGRRVRSVTNALGREEIRLKSGCVIFFPARTRSTLRGWSVDCYLADEAQLLTDQQWESVKPAMAARPNSVAWLAGTAPQLSTDAEVFGRLRAQALAADDGAAGLAWLEYGADDGADLDDRDQWAKANPGRVTAEAIEAERRELSPGGFARERLNLWPTSRTEKLVDADWWASLAGSGPPNGTPPTALAVDAGPDRSVAVAAAWRLDGRTHVELVSLDAGDPLLALQWLIDRAGRRVPVVVDGASAAAAMIPALQAARVRVTVTGARDMARACGTFLSDVEAGRVSHTGQSQLADAVAGARKRPLGDGGAFAWDRRDGSVHISPLVAATLAAHGAATVRPRTGRAMFA